MLKLILIGILAGAFFSSTFILNELMASQGGHWFWSAALRYVFMWLLLSVIIAIKSGMDTLIGLWRLFGEHYKFWCIAGGIGFGLFYAPLCFGADHAPSWVIAATFQFTTVASLIVLAMFGEKLKKQVIAISILIFIGVLLTNIGEGLHGSSTSSLTSLLLLGALPCLVAGFCFPIGNQLVWYTTRPPSTHPLLSKVPHLTSSLMTSPFHKVWLLSVGSLPFWLVLGLIVQPPALGISQAINSLLVALFAGVIATSLFLYARSKASNSGQIAGVDATQATEVIFSLIGGIVILSTPLPSMISWVGIALVSIGLVLFARLQQ
ncbi:MAG: multidrug resistance efflux transporter family protein [Moraxella sp.]|nr:multidrug resistance efflux transporter family protein [Moraxella sp.]